MDSIKSKITKLLALSTSPNENEAKAALLKAQELMVKYKLSESDILVDKSDIITINTGVTHTSTVDPWVSTLASVVADNYCCKSFMRHKYRSRQLSMCFMGFKEDAEVAEVIFQYILDVIYSKINELRKYYKQLDGRTTSQLRQITNSYARGFVEGLEEAFLSQRKTNEAEWGLVLVTPQEVTNFIDSLGGKHLNPNYSVECEEYSNGYEDGKKFSPNKILKSED